MPVAASNVALRLPVLVLVACLLGACGAGRGGDGQSSTPTDPRPTPDPGPTPEEPGVGYYGLRGSVSGLVLATAAGDRVAVAADGAFSFPTRLQDGSSYAVSVAAQPVQPTQFCSIANGSGTIAGADAQIGVTCAGSGFSVGGSVSGLSGGALTVSNAGGPLLAISADGPFQFPQAVADGGAYAVVVQQHPDGQGCAVHNGAGTVAGADVGNVEIVCSAAPFVAVHGLAGAGLTLAGNGQTIPVSADGLLQLPALGAGQSYRLGVSSQPAGQHCTVSSAPGEAAGIVVATVSCVGPVGALYPLNGANWNDYVQRGADPLAGADLACSGLGNRHSECQHGGELRALTVAGPASCEGLSARDALNALQWQCRPIAGGVRIVSSGLRDEAALSDLIDFDAVAWRGNRLEVYRHGELLAQSPAGVWWSNPLAPAVGTLDQAGTIYLANASPANFVLTAPRTALLVRPGLTLEGNGTGGLVRAANLNYLWLEGELLGFGEPYGLLLQQVGYSSLRRLGVAGNSGDGACVRLQGLRASRVHRLHTAYCVGAGVEITDSRGNRIESVVSDNNIGAGLVLESSVDNVLIDVVASNNLGGGINTGDAHHNVLHGITVVNNIQAGLTLGYPEQGSPATASDYNTLAGFAGSNNNSSLYLTSGSDYNRVADVASTDNRRHSVVIGGGGGAASGNHFTGELRIGYNQQSPRECMVENSPTGGLVHLRCTDSGADGSSSFAGQASDAVLRTGVTQGGSFVGKLQAEDGRNGSDSGGAAGHVDAILDWTRFDNRYRAWGVDGAAFPAPSNRGALPSCSDPVSYRDQASCEAAGQVWQTAGRIWDWRLRAADAGYQGAPALRGVLPPPTGDDVLEHAWSDGVSRYLRRAVELAGDGVGNDDGLCEAAERCLYTANIGAYQGEGELLPWGAPLAGELAGVQLYRYAQNGQ